MGRQKTIRKVIGCSGIGLHTGRDVTMTLRPSPPNIGIIFRRMDLADAPVVEARPDNIVDVHYATTLGKAGVEVKTVEHLLAALAGLGIDNISVDLSGPEVPAMDGSAAPFVDLLLQAGIRRYYVPKTYLKVTKPLTIDMGNRSIQVLPSKRFRIHYSMCFDHPCFSEQAIQIEVSRRSFIREIAASRTYSFLRDVEHLWRRGLGLGGSLENAVVIGEDGALNALRFDDELIRHKVLDLIGDLYLLGRPLQGTVVANGGGTYSTRLWSKRSTATLSWTRFPDVSWRRRNLSRSPCPPLRNPSAHPCNLTPFLLVRSLCFWI
ncbi:MAG: UDP-3-O-acyl-N-acetylglucosamine deacetylase [Candidatus Methylomirabilales bacterium]